MRVHPEWMKKDSNAESLDLPDPLRKSGQGTTGGIL